MDYILGTCRRAECLSVISDKIMTFTFLREVGELMSIKVFNFHRDIGALITKTDSFCFMEIYNGGYFSKIYCCFYIKFALNLFTFHGETGTLETFQMLYLLFTYLRRS